MTDPIIAWGLGTVPAIYDADHNCLREFTEIDLGHCVAAIPREEVKP